jgi:hypothetical protein
MAMSVGTIPFVGQYINSMVATDQFRTPLVDYPTKIYNAAKDPSVAGLIEAVGYGAKLPLKPLVQLAQTAEDDL